MKHDASRRHFLRTGTLLTAMGAGGPFAINLAAMANASAQTANDYRALVCLYLGGGNDHLNTFVPFDDTSYNRYRGVRGGLALAKPATGALATTSAQSGRQIGMNDNLAGLKGLYDSGRLAVLANVGALTEPSSRSDLASGQVACPRQLGSHNDQHVSWSALETSNPYGWGGLMGDLLASGNGGGAMFTTISGTGGYSRFLTGAQTTYFTVSDGGIPAAFFDSDPNMRAAVLGGGSARRANLIEQAYVEVHERLRDGATELQSKALAENTFANPPAQNLPAAQLRTVLQIIGANQAFGVRRQIFYVDLGGFDTHGGQLLRHASLMAQLNDALVYFDAQLGQLNMRNNVTLFSTSEFGRTYSANAGGTDHGWGSHHVIIGGAVKGGEIYGTLPDMSQQGPDFLYGSLMIPTTSIEQYGATLARWMGVSDPLIDGIFPSLARFPLRNLGFL